MSISTGTVQFKLPEKPKAPPAEAQIRDLTSFKGAPPEDRFVRRVTVNKADEEAKKAEQKEKSFLKNISFKGTGCIKTVYATGGVTDEGLKRAYGSKAYVVKANYPYFDISVPEPEPDIESKEKSYTYTPPSPVSKETRIQNALNKIEELKKELRSLL